MSMSTSEDRVREIIAKSPVILFMKGTPDEPKCGFSGRAVAALKSAAIEFAYVDVLAAPRIREALPRVSQFPTFPQLFVAGELIGGSDIVADLVKSGELVEMVRGTATSPAQVAQ
jgi:monothiol glutaredoxin